MCKINKVQDIENNQNLKVSEKIIELLYLCIIILIKMTIHREALNNII